MMEGIMNEREILSEKRIRVLLIMFFFIVLFLILHLGSLMTNLFDFLNPKFIY